MYRNKQDKSDPTKSTKSNTLTARQEYTQFLLQHRKDNLQIAELAAQNDSVVRAALSSAEKPAKVAAGFVDGTAEEEGDAGLGKKRDLSVMETIGSVNKAYEITNTIISKPELGIFGAAYTIPDSDIPRFHSLYYRCVFEEGYAEHMTETQLMFDGPLVVDLDFHHDYSVTTRQFDQEDIFSFLVCYFEQLEKYYQFSVDSKLNVYLFMRPNVRRDKEKGVTKDGIHLLFGIKSNVIIQKEIRDALVERFEEEGEGAPFGGIGLVNSWDKVLDEGIASGKCAWQLLGSGKPGMQPYELKEVLSCHYREKPPNPNSSNHFTAKVTMADKFDLKANFTSLTARYRGNPVFELSEDGRELVEAKRKALEERGWTNGGGPATKRKRSSLFSASLDGDDNGCRFDENGKPECLGRFHSMVPLHEIVDAGKLEEAVGFMLEYFKVKEQLNTRDLHYFTMQLPAKYYEPGSHVFNRQVAFALRNTSDNLFLTWIALRAKASDFQYSEIVERHEEWVRMRRSNTSGKSLTRRSILYWLRQDNPEGYTEVMSTTTEFYIDQAIKMMTHYNMALVLHHIYRDVYVCVDVKKMQWYQFYNNRWVRDDGMSIREKISTKLYSHFRLKADALNDELNDMIEKANTDPEPEKTEKHRERLKIAVKHLTSICQVLRNSSYKNSVLRECAELFYDGDFMNKMDSSKTTLCFNNGVVDFDAKKFRQGAPEDYIVKCTNIDYVPPDPSDPEWCKMRDECFDFMNKLFPIRQVNVYMWDHLASALIGENINQTFNLYHGSGSNGKSLLVTFMSHVLGQYAGIVPINLLTDERAKIGGTQSEVLQLKGIRYAIMEELRKGKVLNEAVMKNLTGDSKMQARGLFRESETFEPQFTLVLCTNNLFEIESTDDGTWRRIQLVKFIAKFVEPGKIYMDKPTKFTFPRNGQLDKRLPVLAPVFAGLLVERAFQTGGHVVVCERIEKETLLYRRSQDLISYFIELYIQPWRPDWGEPESVITYTDVSAAFRTFFRDQMGGQHKRIPKNTELNECISKKYSRNVSSKGWVGLRLLRPDEIEDNSGLQKYANVEEEDDLMISLPSPEPSQAATASDEASDEDVVDAQEEDEEEEEEEGGEY